MAALLLIVMKILVKNPKLYSSPEGTHPPPGWIRALLMFTCTGVSFAHGSNDGQKGMGLIMLILIGILPSTFAIKSTSSEMELNGLRMELRHCISYCSTLDKGGNPSPEGKDPSITITRFLRKSAPPTPDLFAAVSALATRSDAVLEQANSLKQVAPEMRGNLRTDLYLLSSVTTKLANSHQLRSSADEKSAERFASCLNSVTNYIPLWVKIAVSLALGLGTMIGWKRIVVTVGEKIGKSHLSYGQGACAELVAMITIMAGDLLGLPISTTHVLSSGVAGTMAANGSGIQTKTLRNIIMAWVLTLPVCVFLGATLFALVLNLLIHLGFM
jgi:PiT family inorganic phosphate transporter